MILPLLSSQLTGLDVFSFYFFAVSENDCQGLGLVWTGVMALRDDRGLVSEVSVITDLTWLVKNLTSNHTRCQPR